MIVLVSTVTTEWANPSMVEQCTSYEGEQYSSWSRLNTVKLDEVDSRGRQLDYCAVCYKVSKNKKSGLVYCSDFGFNLPDNAVITKARIKQIFCGDDNKKSSIQTYLVKLKVGSSTSDTGEGNNVSDNVKWVTHAYAHVHGMQHSTIGNEDKDFKTFYGTTLETKIVNNSDFGCVLQYIGTGADGHKLYLDNVQMQLEYYVPEVAPVSKEETKVTRSTPVSQVKTKPVVQDPYYHAHLKYELVKERKNYDGKVLEETVTPQPYDKLEGFTLWVKITNEAFTDSAGKRMATGYTKPVTITCDALTKFKDEIRTKTIPSFKIDGSFDPLIIIRGIVTYVPVTVYPAVTECVEPITSTITMKYLTDSAHFVTQQVQITPGYNNRPYSQTIIKNCTFTNNSSNKGAAVYNDGRFYIKNCKYYGNHTYGEDKNGCTLYDYICRDFEVL